MATQRLLFVSSDGTILFDTDGTTVTQLADGSSTPVFAEDPLYYFVSASYIGSTVYFTMADSTGTTSAIWQYNGTALTQITSSANYVYNNVDSSDPGAPYPLVSYNGDLIFAQATLASNPNDNQDPDTATLAVYNPTTGTITQPTTPNAGYDPHDFVTIGSTLYFEATDSTTNSLAIYSFNGTSVTEIYNLHPTNTTGQAIGAQAVGAVEGTMVAFNGNIYFGSGNQSVEELTATGSLSNSATNVAPAETLPNGGGYGSGTDLIVFNNHLFFDSANYGVFSLSTSNVVTTVLANAQYYTPVIYNNALYFSAAPSGALNFYSSTGGAATEVEAGFSGTDFIVMGSTLYYNTYGTTLGTYNGTTFGTETVPNNAGGAPLLVVPIATPSWTEGALCFCTGTMIATPEGEIKVERLAAGNKVLTASGTVRTVTWAGAGRVLATRGRRGPATPVVVRKGALADNVPHTDMRVTKGHALFLDGVLVPVEFLINHRSILWDDHAQEVSLRHIELQAHDVLLANGAPAESYRDDGNRWLFQNANDGWGLPPQEPCAPVLTGGETVDRIWRRLLDRAGPHKPPPLTDDADLHLLVDGLRVDAWRRQGPMHMFRLPGAAACVQIVSRDAVPAELGLARDFRSLGVALRWIELSQGPRVMQIEANDPRLAEGFHRYESDGDLRWTNGDARLPAELFKGFSRAVEVMIYVAASTQYPLLPPTRAVA
jgi:hypothetical protein